MIGSILLLSVVQVKTLGRYFGKGGKSYHRVSRTYDKDRFFFHSFDFVIRRTFYKVQLNNEGRSNFNDPNFLADSEFHDPNSSS